MNEEQTYLVEVLQNAINVVYQEERFLLRFAQGDREGLEQAFVFRTGVHLSNLLNETPYAALDLTPNTTRIMEMLKHQDVFQMG